VNFKKEILKVFNEVIKDYYGDAILLSGGLDTSIIAFLAAQYFKPYAITVGFNNEALDLKYAKIIANNLKLQNFIKVFNVKEAAEAVAKVIKIVKSFDPMEIRNDIPLYIAMSYARNLGLKSVVTGDGGDELFAGYSFLLNLELREVNKWLEKIMGNWFFAAKPIGESLGLKVLQPFLDERIIELALKIPAKLKISKAKNTTYGKYILRKAFEKFLPKEVVWRNKDPIEVGSESRRLSEVFQATREEFNELSKIIKLNSLEQAYYLKIYLKELGEIPKPKNGEKRCLKCGGGAPVNASYCRICGAYPI
jgi:asparagine synthase (glutamine-hydrolysing)